MEGAGSRGLHSYQRASHFFLFQDRILIRILYGDLNKIFWIELRCEIRRFAEHIVDLAMMFRIIQHLLVNILQHF
jgi:exoribonuclease II